MLQSFFNSSSIYFTIIFVLLKIRIGNCFTSDALKVVKTWKKFSGERFLPTGRIVKIYVEKHESMVSLLASGTNDEKGERSEMSSGKTEVLLVDDDESILKSVSRYLAGRGVVVTTAASAKEAWVHLQTAPRLPDVLITDINMPGVDGYQLVQKLRSRIEYAALPIVFLSARGMTPDRIQGFRSGGQAYITKPFDPEELISLIDSLAATKRRMEDPKGIVSMRDELAKVRQALVESTSLRSAPKNDGIPPPSLTKREQSVLDRLAEGMTNKEIAQDLDLSLRYVEKVVERMFEKTQTSNRTKLVRYAVENGMVSS